MEDRLKAKDNLIEKLDLKNHSLQTQRWKLSQRVAQKEQMSDMLNAVDFDQLKIENQQYLERIEEKNTELLQVKLTTGRTIQVHCLRLLTFIVLEMFSPINSVAHLEAVNTYLLECKLAASLLVDRQSSLFDTGPE